MCNLEKEHIFGCIGVILIGVIVSIGVISFIDKCIDKYKNSHPVEECSKIDSIANSNKTLIIEVEHLDSIKNEKVIKVKELDNDSTLKLFYQLISE